MTYSRSTTITQLSSTNRSSDQKSKNLKNKKFTFYNPRAFLQRSKSEKVPLIASDPIQ